MSIAPEPRADGAETAFSDRMSYGDYLALDVLLAAQHPLSPAHDEMLFIIQHQTSELWMRLALHELAAARQAIADDRLQPAFKMLTRVARIMEQMNSAWDVLRTLTPSEYGRFRPHLAQSSGFQSWQYRLIEFSVGNRDRGMLAPHAHRPDLLALLEAEIARPSLYDQAIRALARAGLELPPEVLARDVTRPWVVNPAVMEAWTQVYRATERHWPLYELAEKLIDFEDYFRRWRFNHLTTVARIIGQKPGTGGTGGVSYLQRMLDTVLFPELWQLRTLL